MNTSARAPKSSLLDQTQRLIRAKHMSIRTERSYLNWIERFLRFHRERRGEWVHPSELSDAHLNAILSYMAVEGNLTTSTQKQAL